MEKEGLVRCMAKLKAEGLQVGELVTDRHPQISEYVREEMLTTRHFHDVWHVSKGNYYSDLLFQLTSIIP